LRKGVIEISPGRIRAVVSATAVDPGEWHSARLLDVEYQVSPLEASPRKIQELIELAAGEIHAVSGADPEVVIVGDLRGTRLPNVVERISRRVGLGPTRTPSRREQIEGAFLAATVHPGPGQRPDMDVAVVFLADAFLGVAVGKPGFLPGWTASRPLTAKGLADRVRFSDPPTTAQIEAATSAAARSLDSLVPPEPSGVSLVFEEAPAVIALCGTVIDYETVGRALDSLHTDPWSGEGEVVHLSRKDRSRLIATMTICRALSTRFAKPLAVMVPDLALSRDLLDRTGTVSRHHGRRLT